jgi:hypothetical protein
MLSGIGVATPLSSMYCTMILSVLAFSVPSGVYGIATSTAASRACFINSPSMAVLAADVIISITESTVISSN